MSKTLACVALLLIGGFTHPLLASTSNGFRPQEDLSRIIDKIREQRTVEIDTHSMTDKEFAKFFFSSEFQSGFFRNEAGASITVPFEAIPVTFGGASESEGAWETRKQNMGSLKWRFSERTSARVRVTTSTVSDATLNILLTHLFPKDNRGVALRLIKCEPIAIVAISWRPPDGVDKAVITNIQVSPSSEKARFPLPLEWKTGGSLTAGRTDFVLVAPHPTEPLAVAISVQGSSDFVVIDSAKSVEIAELKNRIKELEGVATPHDWARRIEIAKAAIPPMEQVIVWACHAAHHVHIGVAVTKKQEQDWRRSTDTAFEGLFQALDGLGDVSIETQGEREAYREAKKVFAANTMDKDNRAAVQRRAMEYVVAIMTKWKR